MQPDRLRIVPHFSSRRKGNIPASSQKQARENKQKVSRTLPY